MTDLERQKADSRGTFLLIVTVAYFSLSFVLNWFMDYIVGRFFIASALIFLIMFILFDLIAIHLILLVRRGIRIRVVLGIFIMVSSFSIFWFFPFRDMRVKAEYSLFTQKREEVIEKIVTGELVNDNKLMQLPFEYNYLSNDGYIYVDQNDDLGTQISFWVFRGMMSSSYMVIYASGGEDMVLQNETGHPIVSLEQLGENWFYVETEY